MLLVLLCHAVLSCLAFLLCHRALSCRLVVSCCCVCCRAVLLRHLILSCCCAGAVVCLVRFCCAVVLCCWVVLCCRVMRRFVLSCCAVLPCVCCRAQLLTRALLTAYLFAGHCCCCHPDCRAHPGADSTLWYYCSAVCSHLCAKGSCLIDRIENTKHSLYKTLYAYID